VKGKCREISWEFRNKSDQPPTIASICDDNTGWRKEVIPTLDIFVFSDIGFPFMSSFERIPSYFCAEEMKIK
jgi:hypothetical protein